MSAEVSQEGAKLNRRATTLSSTLRALGADVPASLVVFLLALPLSIGIASISGVPIRSGLIAALVGGLIVSPLAGAPLTVAGPAAGLSMVVFAFVQDFGLETTFVIVIIAGALQVLAGFSKLAKVALVVSPALLHALLASIGIMIALSQFHVLLGSRPLGAPMLNAMGIPHTIASLNLAATFVGLTTFSVIMLWERFFSKRWPRIPGALVALVTGSVLSGALEAIAQVNVPHIEAHINLLEAHQLSLSGHPLSSVFVAALGLAFVASAESLLCVVATDALHTDKPSDLDRDLIAKGVGNVVSGLLGGLPVLAEVVRSKANIASGARSRWSGFMHGAWLLIFLIFLGAFLARIPSSALAALLIYVGYSLLKLDEVKHVVRYGDTAVYAVTMIGILGHDLLFGIALGFGLSIVLLLKRTARLSFEIRPPVVSTASLDVVLRGNLNFLTVPMLTAYLNSVPVGRQVAVELDVGQLDHAAIDRLQSWRLAYERSGGKVDLPPLLELFKALNGKRSGRLASV